MRYDIHGKDGPVPSRPSASTLCSSTTSSSSMSSLSQRGPSANGTTSQGASSSSAAAGGSSSSAAAAASSASAASASADYGMEQEVSSLLIIDQHTFEVLHAHQFMQQEDGISLISCKLGDDPNPYYIVGTGIINPEESEPKAGRIIIFQWKDGKFNQVAEKEIKGCCYSLCHFNKKLLAAINSTVGGQFISGYTLLSSVSVERSAFGSGQPTASCVSSAPTSTTSLRCTSRPTATSSWWATLSVP